MIVSRAPRERLIKKMTLKTPAIIVHNIDLTQGKPVCAMTRVSLFDELNLKKIDAPKIILEKIKGFRIQNNSVNLVYQAALALQKKKSGRIGVTIKIAQNVPPEGGLLSEYSQSAGVLKALNKLWKMGLTDRELIRIATAIHPLIGEIMKMPETKYNSDETVILLYPKNIRLNRAWMERKAKEVKNQKINPFQAIAFQHFPDLREMAEILKGLGCYQTGLCGAGPTIFGFSKKKMGLKQLRQKLSTKTDFIWMGKAEERQKQVDT